MLNWLFLSILMNIQNNLTDEDEDSIIIYKIPKKSLNIEVIGIEKKSNRIYTLGSLLYNFYNIGCGL